MSRGGCSGFHHPGLASPTLTTRAPDYESSTLPPACCSTIRSIIKTEIEERLGSHGDFGQLSFARLSFGRQPPVVAGVKGMPLHGNDMLAMGERGVGCWVGKAGHAKIQIGTLGCVARSRGGCQAAGRACRKGVLM